MIFYLFLHILAKNHSVFPDRIYVMKWRIAMCGIAGFCNFKQSYLEEKPYWETILTQMNTSLSHRGMDDSGVFLLPHTGFSHARLSIRDIKNGGQPMTRRTASGSVYSIVYNGEIYNTKELSSALRSAGFRFNSSCR